MRIVGIAALGLALTCAGCGGGTTAVGERAVSADPVPTSATPAGPAFDPLTVAPRFQREFLFVPAALSECGGTTVTARCRAGADEAVALIPRIRAAIAEQPRRERYGGLGPDLDGVENAAVALRQDCLPPGADTEPGYCDTLVLLSSLDLSRLEDALRRADAR
ncbi:hypothetical protein EV383_0469 [Pseudonocardia sediminis]|uniref:Uncharacterized protein n=1 Tax=Pseudonocardia sediminis TaxID=1397368 RepID=A0A4Q7US75_PSEST|nr:hypothetical protein [Pseudonocardia sediminis]RZT83658.1 hypothetical protein EV383_0469 [Pseudonocardia sediminis]